MYNLNPTQIELLTRTTWLLLATMGGGAVSAYLLRKYFSYSLIITCVVASIVMIFITAAVAVTEFFPAILICHILFGAAVAADLGGFFLALGAIYDLSPERTLQATFLTLASATIATGLAGLFGVFSGLNFQGMGVYLFFGLFILLGLGIGGLVGWISQKAEYFIGIAASLFWFVYMIYDFNKIVKLYETANWSVASKVAMGLYLDIINFVIRIAPYIFEAMSKHK